MRNQTSPFGGVAVMPTDTRRRSGAASVDVVDSSEGGPVARGAAGREQVADDVIAALDRLHELNRRALADLPDALRADLESVTLHQLQALASIVVHGGLAMSQLARTQNVAVSSCTALADRLLRQGLVERSSDPHDRRVVRLVPTARGRRVVEYLLAVRRRGLLAVLAALDEEELATLQRLVGKIVDAVDRLTSQTAEPAHGDGDGGTDDAGEQRR